jgi:hypothetical protein
MERDREASKEDTNPKFYGRSLTREPYPAQQPARFLGPRAATMMVDTHFTDGFRVSPEQSTDAVRPQLAMSVLLVSVSLLRHLRSTGSTQ